MPSLPAAWAAGQERPKLSGALIAPGSVVVDSNVKKVQHPTGGVVGELRVRDGDRVKAGDIVVRLDQTVTRANLAIVTKGLDELCGAQGAARKRTRWRGRDRVSADPLTSRRSEPDDRADHGKRTQAVRSAPGARSARRPAARAVGQLQEEIVGLTAQQQAKKREIELITRELEGVRDLFKRNLVQINRLTQLEREATRLDGEQAQLIAAVAAGQRQDRRNRAARSSKSTRILAAKSPRRCARSTPRSANSSNARSRPKTSCSASISARRRTATVFQLTVHTVGGVIAAGEAIMLIVPDADSLTVEARVNPQDIEQVQLDQKTVLRFPAFNVATTPEIDGQVSKISADISTDQRTGQSYYTIRISIHPDQLARLGNVRLVPGMPVECFIQTGDRTVISYLLKPLRDQLKRTFREKG